MWACRGLLTWLPSLASLSIPQPTQDRQMTFFGTPKRIFVGSHLCVVPITFLLRSALPGLPALLFFNTFSSGVRPSCSEQCLDPFAAPCLTSDLRGVVFVSPSLCTFRLRFWIHFELLASLVTLAESSSYCLRSPLFGCGSGSILSYLPH